MTPAQLFENRLCGGSALQVDLRQPATPTPFTIGANVTFLFVRYQWILSDLQQLGITGMTAQGLPGILGRDGWLARSRFA